MKAAIAELQQQGYALPDYPDDPKSDAERDVRGRYDKVKGSAVNPVLRQGNSDRRAPASVKHYARTHPHSMGAWSPSSTTNVAHMTAGDFRSTERSAVIAEAGSLRIELAGDDGQTTVLRESVPVTAGEVVDTSVMQAAALDEFLAAQIARAKAEGILFSVHLKATMMKVSDPIVFGHAVRAFFPDTFARYGSTSWPRPASAPTTGSAPSSTAWTPCRKARRSGRRSTPSWPTDRAWPWSTRTAGSRISTSRATSSSTRRCRR